MLYNIHESCNSLNSAHKLTNLQQKPSFEHVSVDQTPKSWPIPTKDTSSSVRDICFELLAALRSEQG